jgi:hypothetical protein
LQAALRAVATAEPLLLGAAAAAFSSGEGYGSPGPALLAAAQAALLASGDEAVSARPLLLFAASLGLSPELFHAHARRGVRAALAPPALLPVQLSFLAFACTFTRSHSYPLAIPLPPPPPPPHCVCFCNPLVVLF